MPSELKVNKLSPYTGSTLTIGDSGDTISFASGVLPALESLTITGDLTVDTNTLYVDSTNNNVGIGTSSIVSPAVLDVVKTNTAGDVTGQRQLRIARNDNSNYQLFIGYGQPVVSEQFGGNIQATDAGNPAKLLLNPSGGNVGIGTSSPTVELDVTGEAKISGDLTVATDDPVFTLEDTSGGFQEDAKFVVSTSGLTIRDSSDNIRFDIGLSSGDISFYEDTGTTPKLFWDASAESLGIGTSSPGYPLHVFSSVSPSVNIEVSGSLPNTALALTKQQGSGNLGHWTALTINGNDNTSYESRIQWFFDSIADGPIISSARTSSSAADLRFYTTASEVASESMRIDGGKRVGIAMSTVGTVRFAVAADTAFIMIGRDSSGTTDKFRIEADGDVKNINNSYGAFSDIKLKQDITNASSQWEDIKALQVKNYRLIKEVEENADAPRHIGVIAQELEESNMGGLVKESPKQNPDGTYSENETVKNVKYSVLYMKAVKALQEAMARIESLETENTDIKARLEALENA